MYYSFKRKIIAWLLALSILLPAMATNEIVGVAAKEETLQTDAGTTDGPDVSSSEPSTTDGSDASGSDVSGSDVSGPDVSGEPDFTMTQDVAFVVMQQNGEFFGAYEEWSALLADFKAKGDKEQAYTISVSEDAVVGKSMPAQAAEITLVPGNGAEGTLYFASNSLNMTTPLVIEAEALLVAATDKAVNVNTKGKQLTLKNIGTLGTVKGSSKGDLVLVGDVELSGNLQTFRQVTLAGTLQVTGNVSGISNLVLLDSTVYLAPDKSFTVTKVDAVAGGVLGFPAEGKQPKVKLSGQVSGVLDLKLFQKNEQGFEELTFAAGTKLLTAPKATVEQFALAGEGQSCYKKSNVFYVGAEVLMLYQGDVYLDTYSRWSDVKERINALKDKAAEYTVVLLDNYVEETTLSMPAKGRYAGITFANGKGEELVLKSSKGLTLTADTVIGSEVKLQVSQVSGNAWTLQLESEAEAVTTGNFSVKNLMLGSGAGIQTGGKLTVKSLLEVQGDNELVLTHKKGAALKDVQVGAPICLQVIDKYGSLVTPVANTTILTATGTGVVAQFYLLDALGQELPLYTKGTALKVRGDLDTPITLYLMNEGEEAYLGEYTSLAEIKAVIGRLKKKDAAYRVAISKEQFVKGVLPLPKAGTYREIVFSGETIRITGNITLTGHTVFENRIVKVKNSTSDTPLKMTWNLSKYGLSIPEGVVMENMGNVTGATGSCLTMMGNDRQVIGGNLKVDELRLEGVLQVTGSVTVTNVKVLPGNQLDYDLGKTVTIKGTVEGDVPLVLNPMRSGAQTVYTDGMKVLGSAPKVSVGSLQMAQDTPWVLYKEGAVVRLGKVLIEVFEDTTDYTAVQDEGQTGEKQFARINDAIDYINTLETTDFVIRLEENVPSAGAFVVPAAGKKIVLCGLNGERKTLQMTGSVTLDGSSLFVRNVELKSKSSLPGMILKNGASVLLQDSGVNTLSAPAGTAVTLQGDVAVKGAVTGGSAMRIEADSTIRFGSNVAVETLTLEGAEKDSAELRLRVDKKITVKGAVETAEDAYFTVNMVDANDKLADIGIGMVLVVTPSGKVAQFKTQNIMPGSFLPWNLIKKGDNIQTSEASQGDGEWSGDYL